MAAIWRPLLIRVKATTNKLDCQPIATQTSVSVEIFKVTQYFITAFHKVI